MKKSIWIAVACAGAVAALVAQQGHDFTAVITKGERPALAVPDLRGDAQAQAFMAAFNETLWGDLDGAGIFKMVPKTMYPTTIPQQPSDFRMPTPPSTAPLRKGQAPPPPPSGGGLWMQDWSSPPAQANYLAMGYAAAQGNLFVLRGWLMDLRRDSAANAQVVAKTYPESLDEAGARKAAHEFAADILAMFGAKSLLGSHIFYVHEHRGPPNSIKEIWTMDADGRNPWQVTHFNSLSIEPAVSPDGTKIAFASFVHGNPGIFVFSVDPVQHSARDLRFYNQRGASVTAFPSFTPDGKQIIFASSSGTGHCCRIYVANLDGGNLRPISSSGSIEVEPKVNPKTGNDVAFVSGRSGPQQVYRMNMDGADVERLTDGTGEASNPSWHPDGQLLAFSWTRGYMAGKFNIFVMDVAAPSRYNQLTHDEGRNENPSWAPDGKHIAFMSSRRGSYQIWSMLADGTQLQQLTTQGQNYSPALGK
jgi:TolB protein